MNVDSMTAVPIGVGLVDDNPVLLDQLQKNLGLFPHLAVVFTAGNGQEALDKLADCDTLPQVILMDIEMPVMNGIEATRVITANTGIRILMFTVFDTDDKIFEAIRAGAAGYLLKDSRIDKIVSAIDDLVDGGAAMSPYIALKTLNLFRDVTSEKRLPTPDDYNLSQRELDILELLVKGHTYQLIGDSLYISHGTVRKHVENIYFKLHIHSKVEAVNKANEFNWFSKRTNREK